MALKGGCFGSTQDTEAATTVRLTTLTTEDGVQNRSGRGRNGGALWARPGVVFWGGSWPRGLYGDDLLFKHCPYLLTTPRVSTAVLSNNLAVPQ